jgi:hypothetical protein
MSTHILSFDSDSFCPALVPEFGAEEAWCLPNLHPLVVRNCFEGRIPRSAFGRWPVWTPTFGSDFFFRTKGRANVLRLGTVGSVFSSMGSFDLSVA